METRFEPGRLVPAYDNFYNRNAFDFTPLQGALKILPFSIFSKLTSVNFSDLSSCCLFLKPTTIRGISCRVQQVFPHKISLQTQQGAVFFSCSYLVPEEESHLQVCKPVFSEPVSWHLYLEMQVVSSLCIGLQFFFFRVLLIHIT